MYYNMITDEKIDGYMVDESSMNSNFDYKSVYRSPAFTECMNYFDIKDNYTRSVLLSVNEAGQEAIMTGLAGKLYKHIIDKVYSIDFGTIPNSKGDIKKIENYEQLTDCINILSQILQQYKQPTDKIDTVSIALDNMIDRRDLFIRGYKLGVDICIISYNTLALSIVSSISLLISSHIEFIKMANNNGYNIAFDKSSKIKTNDKLLFNNLARFNKLCSTGEFDKIMEYAIKNNVSLQIDKDPQLYHEALSIGGILGTIVDAGRTVGGFLSTTAANHPVLIGVAAVIIGIIALIFIIRELIFYFYYARVKASDYLDSQSSLLYMNAMNIQSNLSKDDKSKKEIADKQSRIAKEFTKLADKIRVNDKAAENKASAEVKKLNAEKLEIKEVIDNIPDSAQASLF